MSNKVEDFVKAITAQNTNKALSILENNPEIVNQHLSGVSALAFAVQYNNGYIVSKLIEAGANPHSAIRIGGTQSALDYAQSIAEHNGREPLAYDAIRSHVESGQSYDIDGFVQPMSKAELDLMKMDAFDKVGTASYIESLRSLPPDADIFIYHGTNDNKLESVLDMLKSPAKGVEQRSGPTFAVCPSGAFWKGNQMDGVGFRYSIKREMFEFQGENNPNAQFKIQSNGLDDSTVHLTNGLTNLPVNKYNATVLVRNGYSEKTTTSSYPVLNVDSGEKEFKDGVYGREKLQPTERNLQAAKEINILMFSMQQQMTKNIGTQTQDVQAQEKVEVVGHVKPEMGEAELDVVVDPYDDIIEKATANLGDKGVTGIIRDANKESGSYIGKVAAQNDKFAAIDIGKNHLIVVPNDIAGAKLETGKRVELKFNGGIAKDVSKAQGQSRDQGLSH